MNTTALRVLVVATVLAGFRLLYAAGADQNDGTQVRCVKSAEAAVARAFEYTGFTEIKDVTSSRAREIAQMITAQDSTTPFLSDSIDGRRVWRVTLDSVFLDSPHWHPDWVQRYNPKSFIALIDSATGRLFKIYSEYKGYDPDLAPEPPAKWATDILRGTGERFHSFPDDPPEANFLRALNGAVGSNPLKAKEIVAILVLMVVDGELKPVWSIIGRGIPPFEIHERTGVSMRYRNRQRTVVDATTGLPLFVVNTPRIKE